MIHKREEVESRQKKAKGRPGRKKSFQKIPIRSKLVREPSRVNQQFRVRTFSLFFLKIKSCPFDAEGKEEEERKGAVCRENIHHKAGTSPADALNTFSQQPFFFSFFFFFLDLNFGEPFSHLSKLKSYYYYTILCQFL